MWRRAEDGKGVVQCLGEQTLLIARDFLGHCIAYIYACKKKYTASGSHRRRIHKVIHNMFRIFPAFAEVFHTIHKVFHSPCTQGEKFVDKAVHDGKMKER